MTNEQQLMALVARGTQKVIRAVGQVPDHRVCELRTALHEMIADATERWAEAKTDTLVLAIGKWHHSSCKRETDRTVAEMRLVHVNSDGATFRCCLCREEVSLCVNFVVPGERQYTAAEPAKSKVRTSSRIRRRRRTARARTTGSRR